MDDTTYAERAYEAAREVFVEDTNPPPSADPRPGVVVRIVRVLRQWAARKTRSEGEVRMNTARKIAKRMEACPLCSALGSLFVGLSGRNLSRILAVADAKGVSVDTAADLLLDAGYEALHGRSVLPDETIPIVQVREHSVPIEERVEDMKRTEEKTGRKVIAIGLLTGHRSLGIPKTIPRSAVLTSMFAGRFRDKQREIEVSILGMKSDDRFEAKKKSIEDDERAAKIARLSEVARFLLDSGIGSHLAALPHMWKSPRNARGRRHMKRHGWTEWFDSMVARVGRPASKRKDPR